MHTIIVHIAVLTACAVLVAAADPVRFVQTIQLSSGQTVVVAEGDREPRSVGSYSVRLYAAENPQFPTDDFLAGVVHPRDGVLEKVLLAYVDEDEEQDLVVVARGAGSGGYLSAQAFSITEKDLALLAAVDGLNPRADPLSALKSRVAKRE